MSLPTSRHAYLDCLSYMDSALEDPMGIRMRQPGYDEAVHLRSRIHQARKLLRDDSRSIYELGDPKYNVTAYDTIVCRIRNHNGVFYLYLEQIVISTDIEPLSDLEDLVAIPNLTATEVNERIAQSKGPDGSILLEPIADRTLKLLEDMNEYNRSQGLDAGNPPLPLATSLGTGDRDGDQDRSEDGPAEPAVRSPTILRRI